MTRTLSVFVRGLEIQAGIGVHDHEIGRLQTLVIDVELTLAVDGPIERLAETVNYERIAEDARAIAGEGHIGLVEHFADQLAERCMADHRVTLARVRVAKPGALEGAEAPGCELTLTR